MYGSLSSGRDLKKEVEGNLEITAPGFVVGFEKISLDPSEELTVSISPDGEILSFTASSDGETPTIYVTTEAGPDKPSYSFEVGGVSLDAGKTLTMFADVEEGKVFLRVYVNTEGAAEKIELQTSSGWPRLDQAAQDTVRSWRFIPAKQGDQAVAAWVIVPINFAL